MTANELKALLRSEERKSAKSRSAYLIDALTALDMTGRRQGDALLNEARKDALAEGMSAYLASVRFSLPR